MENEEDNLVIKVAGGIASVVLIYILANSLYLERENQNNATISIGDAVTGKAGKQVHDEHLALSLPTAYPTSAHMLIKCFTKPDDASRVRSAMDLNDSSNIIDILPPGTEFKPLAHIGVWYQIDTSSTGEPEGKAFIHESRVNNCE